MKVFRAICPFAAVVALMALASCSQTYKNINYLQDVDGEKSVDIVSSDGILIQPLDMISIVVSCHNNDLAKTVNLPIATYRTGDETNVDNGQNGLLGYAVGEDGTIDFPVLGRLKVSGMTRWQLSEYIKKRLIDEKYIMDPVVTVQFMNFKVTVMGEVTNPGTINITSDKITVLEAIARARDLTIYGRRDNVKVIREDGDKRTVYELDLRSSDIFSSPAYYLKQNDIIYVEPNKVRAGQSTINENSVKSASFWVSIGSLGVTIATLVATLVR